MWKLVVVQIVYQLLVFPALILLEKLLRPYERWLGMEGILMRKSTLLLLTVFSVPFFDIMQRTVPLLIPFFICLFSIIIISLLFYSLKKGYLFEDVFISHKSFDVLAHNEKNKLQ